MKQFIAAALAAVAFAESLPKCMYCKRNDENSGFLNSWSYCKPTDTCLKNVWNYIQRPCGEEGWQKGTSYNLDACEPEDIACPEFVTDPDKYQTYSNNTWSLAQGGKCTVKIDSTLGVARVVFDWNVKNSQLGVMFPPYGTGDVISFDSGVNEIVIYNAAESGPLTFDISFSGAAGLIAGATAILAALSF